MLPSLSGGGAPGGNVGTVGGSFSTTTKTGWYLNVDGLVKTMTNQGIAARLVINEFVEGAGGWTFSAWELFYSQFGREATIEMLGRLGGFFGATDTQIENALNDMGGIDAVMNVLRQAGTAGLAPKSGNVYVRESSDLNLPAGEYVKGSIYIKNGKYYKVVDMVNWKGQFYVYQSAMGIPNLSWMGEWEEIPNPATTLGTGTFAGSNFGTGNQSQGGSQGSSEEQSSGNPLLPFIFGGLGFTIGGPVGAIIGFGIGSGIK